MSKIANGEEILAAAIKWRNSYFVAVKLHDSIDYNAFTDAQRVANANGEEFMRLLDTRTEVKQ